MSFKFWRGSPRRRTSIFLQAKPVPAHPDDEIWLSNFDLAGKPPRAIIDVCLIKPVFVYRDGEVGFQILIYLWVCADEMAHFLAFPRGEGGNRVHEVIHFAKQNRE